MTAVFYLPWPLRLSLREENKRGFIISQHTSGTGGDLTAPETEILLVTYSEVTGKNPTLPANPWYIPPELRGAAPPAPSLLPLASLQASTNYPDADAQISLWKPLRTHVQQTPGSHLSELKRKSGQGRSAADSLGSLDPSTQSR